MPYARRRPRRFRRRRKVAWYDRKYSTAQIAKQALRATKYIRGLVNSEMFHHDVGHDATAVPNTGLIYPIVSLAIGDGDGARTGRSVFLRTLLSRIRFTKHASASTTVIRLMLIQDNQQISDTTPAIADILQYVDVDSPLNLNSSGRFKVLKNATIMLDTNKPMYHTEKYRKLWHHVRYNGDAATDIQKGGLYWLMLSDQVTNTPVVDYYTRVGYHDN